MKICVTGCGGFLGSEIVRQLIQRGDTVVGLGRRPYADLSRLGMQLVQGDVSNCDDLAKACDSVDAVIHTAAVAGVWGPYQEYYQTNMFSTVMLVQTCKQLGVSRLVHCSSPSVTFGGDDQSGVDESEPYPARHLSHYSKTKADAERHVLNANDPGRFATCALRPHLIWSADDPHLFPRLIEKAKSGKLWRVGSGENLIDTIHVRNAAHAHILALDKLDSHADEIGGRAFFVSQGEPVACWRWISQILEIAGVPVPKKSISFPAAYAMGAVLERLYKVLGRTDRLQEPPMTRFLAAQLAKDHYFDIGAARDLLGYEPLISTQQGLAELHAAWQGRQW